MKILGLIVAISVLGFFSFYEAPLVNGKVQAHGVSTTKLRPNSLPQKMQGCFFLQEPDVACEVCDSIRFKAKERIEVAIGCDTLGRGKWKKKGGVIQATLKFTTFCSHYIDDAQDENIVAEKCADFERRTSYKASYQFKKQGGRWYMKSDGQSWRHLGKFYRR